MSRSFEQHQVTVQFGLIYPNIDGEHLGVGQESPLFLPLPSTSIKDMRLDGYLEYPYAAKMNPGSDLQHQDGRIPVWRDCGEFTLTTCIRHRPTGSSPGMMVPLNTRLGPLLLF
ncbi:hypothetical protein TNCV_2485191 [Trichonephila clavipes]|uniref:Uncharacterized protein n=1 Tax=Trichonephila clavipes TaxID=2585209 RepID=A0A8X7BC79_TRICX|nr:hypothetical protein TNCV_2485191 [Trichonephila clavipes]